MSFRRGIQIFKILNHFLNIIWFFNPHSLILYQLKNYQILRELHKTKMSLGGKFSNLIIFLILAHFAAFFTIPHI